MVRIPKNPPKLGRAFMTWVGLLLAVIGAGLFSAAFENGWQADLSIYLLLSGSACAAVGVGLGADMLFDTICKWCSFKRHQRIAQHLQDRLFFQLEQRLDKGVLDDQTLTLMGDLVDDSDYDDRAGKILCRALVIYSTSSDHEFQQLLWRVNRATTTWSLIPLVAAARTLCMQNKFDSVALAKIVGEINVRLRLSLEKGNFISHLDVIACTRLATLFEQLPGRQQLVVYLDRFKELTLADQALTRLM